MKTKYKEALEELDEGGIVFQCGSTGRNKLMRELVKGALTLADVRERMSQAMRTDIQREEGRNQ